MVTLEEDSCWEVKMIDIDNFYHYCNFFVLDISLFCLNRRVCLELFWCILLEIHVLKYKYCFDFTLCTSISN